MQGARGRDGGLTVWQENLGAAGWGEGSPGLSRVLGVTSAGWNKVRKTLSWAGRVPRA